MAIDFLIPTFNEEVNLPFAIESTKGLARRVFVVDSGSSDRTKAVAEEHGATFVHHPWEGYARQKNWALDNLPWESEWVFILDADEALTPELKDELRRVCDVQPETVPHAGFYVNRYFVFMGRIIRHCGYFPSWNLRLFKRGSARYEDRAIHEHMVTTGTQGYLRGLLWHEDRRGLEYYVAKHNRYSTLEAEQVFYTGHAGRNGDHDGQELRPRIFGNALERRRFLRDRIYPMLPGKWIFRFLYMYVLKEGFMDGLTGLRFCLLISTHEFFIYLKVLELDYLNRSGQLSGKRSTATAQVIKRSQLMPEYSPPSPPPPAAAAPAFPADAVEAEHPSIDLTPRYQSEWRFSEKVKRAIWMIVRATLFRWSFHNWYIWRSAILRFFGAKIGRGVRVRPTVSIEIPWHVEIGDGSVVGDHAILYSLGNISIGRHVVISQYAHLCAGSHDYTSRKFPLLRPPILVGDEAWIAADAFVGPGVTVGARAVVGARSSVFEDVPADQVVGGSPARVIKPRELRD
jgi:acetyltransferase-like isoleucine patch superfamily enzyme/glycosyltransferase involved in cell wall biosynthesis